MLLPAAAVAHTTTCEFDRGDRDTHTRSPAVLHVVILLLSSST